MKVWTIIGPMVCLAFFTVDALAQKPNRNKAAKPDVISGRASVGNRPVMKNQMDSVSYVIGLQLGMGMKNDSLTTIDPDLIAAGVRAAFVDDTASMPDVTRMRVMTQFQMDRSRRHQAQQEHLGEKNLREGEEFLARNRKNSMVQTTMTGLQYRILTPGTGAVPTDADQVTVHYHGTLIDGTVFDSSRERNQAATFPVNAVIPGWVEALKLMHEGGRMEIWIPSGLAYGEGGMPPKIGPNSVLIFEIELLKVLPTGSGQGQ